MTPRQNAPVLDRAAAATVRPLATTRRPAGLPAAWRKALLLAHILASVGWLGVTATFVVLTFALLGVRDPAVLRSGYVAHELLVTWLARPAALATLGTGLVLALATPWGLLRHWWVPAKLLLLVATVALTVTVCPDTLKYVVDDAEAVGTATYTGAQHTLLLMALYHVVMIGAAAALSVFKPGGRIRARQAVGGRSAMLRRRTPAWPTVAWWRR
jgi:hypothetical protein